MLCVHKGKVCLQVWKIKTEKWVYIPFKKWLYMTDKAKSAYIID